MRLTHEGYGRQLFGIAVFPRLPDGDDLGLSPYGWDLIFHEAFVEHCQLLAIGFGTDIL